MTAPAAARFVVSGTDTGIGKTVFSAGLAGALGAAYWKPIQAGLDGETDSQAVRRLSQARVLPETYRLKLPASPHYAAEAEGITIDPAALIPPDGPLVIEGAGGLMVPLARDTLYIDVFARWKLPLVLCARTSLGTINHSLLSIAAIKARGIPLAGVAFIGDYNEDSEATICEMGQTRRLGRLPPLDPLDADTLRAAFARAFDATEFG
jgi:dethiobiotin synthetase